MRPHGVPRDRTTPLRSVACASGTSAIHAAGAMTRYTPRTVASSSLVKPMTANATKTITAPTQPTDDVTCTVNVNLRRLGENTMTRHFAGDGKPPPGFAHDSSCGELNNA